MAGENAGDGGPAKQRRSFAGTIAKTVAAMVAGALFLAATGLYWATRESDTVSVERQARSAQHAIQTSIDELALQQETVAIWDDAASNLVGPRRDMDWIHDNIGSWLHRIFGQDEVFILDGADRPFYAAGEGQRVPLERYAALSPDLGHVVNGVRGRHREDNGRHDRNPNRPLAQGSTVRTTPRATHDSHMLLVDRRPAAVSAMLVQPSTAGYVQAQGNWPVLVSIRYLDRGFLTELSSRQLIASPRFSRRAGTRPGEYAIPLRNELDTTIGYLIWQPELPGSRILWKLLPLTILILLILASFMTLLGRRLRIAIEGLAAARGQAAHMAFHDALTGLPNRVLFQDRLDALTSCPDAEAKAFSLVLLDVDEFKLTNDTLGHDAGDALLRAIADRLQRTIGPDDLVARLGGDEFALLLGRADSRHALEEFCGHLLKVLQQPCEHRGKVIDCRTSIGATLADGTAAGEEILKRADLALYAAKNAGRGVFRLYEPSMREDMLARSEMLTVARKALAGDFVRPYYQPKVHLRSGEIVGFEALLRCCPPGEKVHGPERLAASFEDSDLAARLSDRMIELTVADMARWQAAGLPFGHVAINAAAAELRHEFFAERLIQKLRSAGIRPHCVQIEVTESVLLGRGAEQVARSFETLAAAGIKLALDDFGTGFASLSHLKQYPVEIIKIDKTFVRDMQVDPEDGAIVDALVGLAQALKLEVVAEGIETRAQHDFLAALGCHVGQGFLFGKAIPADQVPELLGRAARQRRAAA